MSESLKYSYCDCIIMETPEKRGTPAQGNGLKMEFEQKKPEIKEIVRNVREGIRTKADLKRCGCDSCERALEILKGDRIR